jgi:hypothetical protein
MSGKADRSPHGGSQAYRPTGIVQRKTTFSITAR